MHMVITQDLSKHVILQPLYVDHDSSLVGTTSSGC